MKQAGSLLLYVAVFAGLFVLFQLLTCWIIWQLHVNGGYTPEQGPVECTIETIKGHFD